jgi:hypothetical protein
MLMLLLMEAQDSLGFGRRAILMNVMTEDF